MNRSIIAIFIYLYTICCFSQETTGDKNTQKVLLSHVISQLEQQHGVTFSYVDQYVVDKKVVVSNTMYSSLSNSIQSLQQQTHLNFKYTDKKYITIHPYTSQDSIAVCGYIMDTSNTPLEDISVFFKGIRANITTNKDGYFEQSKVPYNSPILISATGFRQRVFNSKLFLKTCDTIYLRYDTETLDEVTITNYLTKGITKDKATIHINPKEVSILPGLSEPDILQSIQQAPGVNSPFETASGIYVRGSAPHQNLVLWNGIKTYQQGHLFGMISAFNPYVVKEVNFTKNGVPAQYGDRIAGVIDIKTEHEIIEKGTGSFGFNMINADAVVHVPLIEDHLSLQVSGRRSFTDGLETFTYKKYAGRIFQNTRITDTIPLIDLDNTFFFWDYNANLIAKLSEKSSIEVNTIHSKNSLNFKRRDTLSTYNDELNTENEGYNIITKNQWNSRLYQEASMYYSKYLTYYQFTTTPSTDTYEIESKRNSIRDLGANFSVTYDLSEAQKIMLGYQYHQNQIKYAFVTSTPNYELTLDRDDRSLQTHAGHTTYIYDTPQQFYLSVGLRLNHYQTLQKTYLEPRVYVQQHLTKHFKISASGEYRSQASSKIRESIISDLSLENEIWTLADERTFPIVTSYQATLGSSYKKKKWLIDLECYYKKINHLTSLTAGFINPVDNVYHQGESSIFGLDFFLKKRFKNYNTWVSYSYINIKNQFDDVNNNNEFPGNWNIEHTLKWSHFYTLNQFKFSLGWIWHTGKSFTNIEDINDENDLIVLDYGAINANTLPIYHRLDISAIYDFKRNSTAMFNYQLGVSILNLYDRKSTINRELRTTNTLQNQVINNSFESIGVTPNISFRIFW